MKYRSTRDLATAGIIAALYAALALLSSAFGLAYGGIQLRLSEALCLLPFLIPAAPWGLFVGCLMANLLSPYGLLDLMAGSLATLLAGLLSRKMSRPWLSALPPIFCNMLLVGAVLSFQSAGLSAAFWPLFLYNALSIGLGEALVCFGLGLPLLKLLRRQKKL